MWNRRDFAVLAAAALATFGLTVGTFWPRVAHAVDGQPAATTEVKVPTLYLGRVEVTAQLDKEKPHDMMLRVKNTSAQAASAKFLAQAEVSPPSNPFSRGIRMSNKVWSDDYAIDLQPDETRTITVTLPDAAFVVEAVPEPSDKVPAAMRTVPGRSYVTLANTEGRASVVALQLPATPKSPPEVPGVAKVVSKLTQSTP